MPTSARRQYYKADFRAGVVIAPIIFNEPRSIFLEFNLYGNASYGIIEENAPAFTQV